jgi:hypothetical protein
MSVIFQTLKKMRSSPKQDLDVADPAPDRRHGLTLSGMLLSPPLLTAVLLVIGLSAVVTIFGINRAKGPLAGGPKANTGGNLNEAAENPEDDSRQAVPTPDAAPEDALPEDPIMDGEALEPAGPPPLTASYLPPQPPARIAFQPAGENPPQLNHPQKSADPAVDRIAGQDPLKRDAAFADGADPSWPIREKPNPAYLSHVQNRLQGLNPTGLSDELARKTKDLADPPDGNAESEPSPESHHHQAAVAKSTRIAVLIEDTKAAISRKDTAAIRRLLTQLGRLKGPESPYVLNLTAYWHLTQKDYAAAGQLLKQVLNLKRDDLEAGYNMALVEIHGRKPKEAYRRLARLREIYPDNLAVAELMGKLK